MAPDEYEFNNQTSPSPLRARLNTWSRRDRIRVVLVFCVGALLWWATMGSAALYSHAAHEDLGQPGWYFLGITLLTIAGSCTMPRHPIGAAVASSAAGILLAPFTAARGDNDGLWLWIVPATLVVAYLETWLSKFVVVVGDRWRLRDTPERTTSIATRPE